MAHRQEQESANPEVTEVAPNVLRMQLPIRMPGLGHVNMYALLDDKGAAVVDPGLPGPLTWKAIQNRLRQAELKPMTSTRSLLPTRTPITSGARHVS